MADNEAHNSSEQANEVESVNGVQDAGNEDRSASKAPDAREATAVASKPASRGTSPALASPGSGLVPLRGSVSNANSPTISMPHPKKFSHSDINKRFLEKNSQVATASHAPAASSVVKPPSSIRASAISLHLT